MADRRCQVVPPARDTACGEPATHIVTFSDGDRAFACQECALRIQEFAKSLHTTVAIDPNGGPKRDPKETLTGR